MSARDNNNLVDQCDCGCGLELDEDVDGFDFKIVDEHGAMLHGYSEYKMKHDYWVNYLPGSYLPGSYLLGPTGQSWKNFKNSITDFYLKNPYNKVWIHLYNVIDQIELFAPEINGNSQIITTIFGPKI